MDLLFYIMLDVTVTSTVSTSYIKERTLDYRYCGMEMHLSLSSQSYWYGWRRIESTSRRQATRY
jgi:hypothetical protein